VWDPRTSTTPVAEWEVLQDNQRSLGMVTSVVLKKNSENSTVFVVSGHEDGSVAISDVRKMRYALNFCYLSLELCILCEVLCKSLVNNITTQYFRLKSVVIVNPYSRGVVMIICTGIVLMIATQLCYSGSCLILFSFLPVVFVFCYTSALFTFHTGVSSIALRSDQKIVVSGHWDNTVRLYDRKKLKCLAILRWVFRNQFLFDSSLYFRYHKENVFAVKFGKSNTPEKTLFASSSKDHQIAIWDLFADTYNE
jgi:WD40 repeat protein